MRVGKGMIKFLFGAIDTILISKKKPHFYFLQKATQLCIPIGKCRCKQKKNCEIPSSVFFLRNRGVIIALGCSKREGGI